MALVDAWLRAGLPSSSSLSPSPFSPPSPLQRKVFTMALGVCCRARDGGLARRVLEAMESHGHLPEGPGADSTPFSAALDASALAGDLPAAGALLDRMLAAGVLPEGSAISNLLRAFTAAGRARDAMVAVRRMEEVGKGTPLERRVYGALLSALGEQGRAEEALALVDRLVGEGRLPTPLPSVLFSPLLGNLAEQGKGRTPARQVWAVWEALRERHGVEPKLSPWAFHGMAQCLEQEGQHAKLLALCESLRGPDGSIPLHPAVVTAALRAAEAVGDDAAVLRYCRERTEALQEPLSVRQLRLGFVAALRQPDGGGSGSAALAMLETAPTSPALRPLQRRNVRASALVELRRNAEAKALYADGALSLASPSPRDETVLADVYEARLHLAVGAARRGELGEAWAQLGEIERVGWQPRPSSSSAATGTAHVGVALELLKRGQAEEAMDALRRLGRFGPSSPHSQEPYRIVLGAAARASNAHAALRLLAEMKAQALPITPMSYNSALYACANAKSAPSSGSGKAGGGGGGYLAEARALFQEMLGMEPPPTLANYNTYLLALARHGQVNEAREVVEGMAARGVRPSVVSYNTALAAGAAAGAWSQVQGLLRAMEAERGVAPDVVSYNTAMSTFQQPAASAVGGGGSGEGEGEGAVLALALLEEMRGKGLRPDTTTYNILVDVCCKAGRLDAARGLLPTMKAERRGPDRLTFNSLAHGYLRARRFEEAWAVLEEMQQAGCRPDAYTHRLGLKALAALGRDGEVEARVRSLLRGHGGQGQGRRAVQAAHELVEVVLVAMATAGRAGDGIALMRRLEKEAAFRGGLTAEAFVSAVHGSRAAGDLEGGAALLAEARRRQLPVSRRLVLPLVKLAGKQLEWERVLSLLELLEAGGGRLDLELHNMRLRALAHLGDAERCRAGLADMRAQGVEPNGDSFSWTLRAEQAGGAANTGGLRRMLHQSRDGALAPTQELIQAQVVTLRKLGNWRGLLKLLDLVADGGLDGVRVTTGMTNHALSALAQKKLWALSLQTIARMGGGGGRSGSGGSSDSSHGGGGGGGDFSGAPPDAVTYLHQIVALGQLGRWQDAVALLYRVQDGALGPQVVPEETMYTAAAAACARAGRLTETQEVMALREANGFKPTVYSCNTLLQAYARLGQVEAALAVLAGIKAQTGEEPDVVSYNSLIEAHRERGTPLGDADGVLNIYRRLLASAVEGPGGLRPDSLTYTALLSACVPAGQWPVALYLHGEAQFLLKADGDGRVKVLRTLLGALEELGVDGLFAARAYEEAASVWRGCISHWQRDGDGGRVLDFHDFSRAMTKAALTYVLERDFVGRFTRPALAGPDAAAEAPPRALSPLVMVVGRGRHSHTGEPLLKDEVQRFLASLNPPLRAVTPPHNAGRLVVSAGQLRAYIQAQQAMRQKGQGVNERGR